MCLKTRWNEKFLGYDINQEFYFRCSWNWFSLSYITIGVQRCSNIIGAGSCHEVFVEFVLWIMQIVITY